MVATVADELKLSFHGFLSLPVAVGVREELRSKEQLNVIRKQL